jgi:hypothetical protein
VWHGVHGTAHAFEPNAMPAIRVTNKWQRLGRRETDPPASDPRDE